MASSAIASTQKILFTTNPQDNLGDISCAFKCAQSLVQAGTLEDRQVEIRAPNLERCQNFHQYHFAIGPLLKPRLWHFRGDPELEEVSDLALQVIAPSTGCGDAFYHLRRKGIKTLSLFEYGFDPDRIPVLEPFYLSVGLGLGPDKAGIFIEHDWEKQHLLTSRAQRMERLNEISSEMRLRVVGDLSLEAFAKSCGLYVGYSSDDTLRLGFVDALLKTNQSDEMLVFTLPRFDLDKNKRTLEEICRMNHVQTLIISDEKKERSISIGGVGRIVRCCVGDFNHRDLLILWQSSEEEVLVTGDQSISEAISANKRFCYEERDHKVTFSSSLANLFSRCRPIQHARRTIPTVKTDRSNTYDSYSKIMQQIFLPAHREHFTAFNREVCKNYNCVPYVDKVIRQMLESGIENKIVYLFDSDHFDPTQLEDGIVYILSLDQVSQMQMRCDNGKSMLPELEGKIFQSGDLAGLHYVVQTTKSG